MFLPRLHLRVTVYYLSKQGQVEIYTAQESDRDVKHTQKGVDLEGGLTAERDSEAGPVGVEANQFMHKTGSSQKGARVLEQTASKCS